MKKPFFAKQKNTQAFFCWVFLLIFSFMSTVIKLVLVGDNGGGKTSMLTTFACDSFPSIVPTVFDNYAMDMVVDGHEVSLGLWDTGGACDYERLRPYTYPQTDVFLVCFSVVSRSSFEYCRNVIHPELQKHCPKVPVILVGLKTDLRTDIETLTELKKKGEHPITPEEGEELCVELGFVKYMECCSKTQEGLKEVFDEVVRVFFDPNCHVKNNKRDGERGGDCVIN